MPASISIDHRGSPAPAPPGVGLACYVNGRVLNGAPGGVRRYTEEIVRRLPGEARVIQPPGSMRGWRGHAWEQFQLPRLSPGVLWNPGNSGPLRARRQVVTIHDMATLDEPGWFSSGYSRWYGWLLPQLARRACRVLTDSQFSKARILHHCPIPAEKVEVVYPGVSTDWGERPEPEVGAVLARLGIPARRYVLYVGTLEPRKNLPILIRAWAEAGPRLPSDFWLVIAGARGDGAVFGDAALGELPPRIHATGYVPDEDLPALYTGAQVFVFPSLYEGFGLPPLEAMACGTPVLASRAGSLPEVLGEAAWSFDPLDASDLAAQLVELLGSSGARMALSAAGRRRAAEFTWTRCAEQIWAVLQSVARQERSSATETGR